MPHLVCGCCHGSTAAPIALASPRGPRRASGSAHARAARAAPASANPGVQGYSPPPPSVSPIKGLIDFHTHAAPDIFGRAIDDDELAALAASRQMEAIVFKNHVTHTADRAWLVRKHVPGIKRVVPSSTRVGILWNPANPGTAPQVKIAEGAAPALGLTVLRSRSRALDPAIWTRPSRRSRRSVWGVSSSSATRRSEFNVIDSPSSR